MELLQTLFEDEKVQSYINSQNDQILKGAGLFSEFPKVIKEYVINNLSQFVDTQDTKITHENICIFTEAAVHQFLSDISDCIVENTL